MEHYSFPPSSCFVSSCATLPNGDDMLLDDPSDESTAPPMSLGSPGSSLLEFYTAAAVDAVPDCVVGGGAAPLHPGLDFHCMEDYPEPAEVPPDANKRRSGGVSGMGGRPLGTGLRTRENFPRGALRILSEAMQQLGTAIMLDDAFLGDVPVAARDKFGSLLRSWRHVPGKEEIWAIPYLCGVTARFSVWGKTDHGRRSICSTWISDNGAIRCTCVGSDTYSSDASVNRDSTCEHIDVFAEAVQNMSEALARPVGIVKQWLFKAMGSSSPTGSAADGQADDEAAVWRFHKDIVVVVSLQRGSVIPVPVYLPRKGVSCGFCPLANLAGCSHTRSAEQYRSSAGNPAMPVSVANYVRSAVSTKPISLFNCPESITFDRRVGELARRGRVYVLEAPDVCTVCGAQMASALRIPDKALAGILHSSLGPCKMEVMRRTCDACNQVCSRDGRENKLILLSWTSGCTVLWGRRCAELVRSGSHISDVINFYLGEWRGLRSAGLLPKENKPRAADTLRALILTTMRLCVVDPDFGLYDCTVCRLPSGRYLVVTADGICLGYDAGSTPFSFEHVCESAPFVNMKTREGCMVLGEQARRILRHVLVPDDPAAVTDRTLPSSEMALSCIFPSAFGSATPTMDTLPAAKSVRRLLGFIWKIEAAAIPLAESLLAAYKGTKVKRLKEKERRVAMAKELEASLVRWQADNPDAVATHAWTAAPAEEDGKGGGDDAGAEATGGAQGTSANGGRGDGGRGPTSTVKPRRKRPKPKEKVKPGEEPALLIPKPLLQPVMRTLDSNDVDHICRMALAFALDPVIDGLKQRHFAGLTAISETLRGSEPRAHIERMVAEATGKERGRFPMTREGQCLVELRHIKVALQAAVLVFDRVPAFAQAIADVLQNAVECATRFYADFSEDLQTRHEYLERYLKPGMSDDEMIAAFQMRYPSASTKTSATGVYTPGRMQCRAEAYDKTPCGTCEKGFSSSDKFSDGALTLCCACAHPKMLGFVVLDRKESPQVLINVLLTRFPSLPRYLVYDFACGVVRCAMVKLPWMLRDLSVVSDRFHVCNHTCSHFYNANSYGELDYKNTLTHEQRNAAIRKMEQILRGAGRYGYMALLCYQTSVLNSFAESRSVYQQDALADAEAKAEALAQQPPGSSRQHQPGPPQLTLPPSFDKCADYFSRYACRCCGYMRDGSEMRSARL